MTDYSKNEDYASKDALATGDPDKLVLGSQIDAEFTELVTAVASKFDSSDIASVAEAQALVSNTTLITPARLGAVLSSSGAGAVGDIVALTDPGADRLLGWDDSADAVIWFQLGTGLDITADTLDITEAEVDHNALLNYVADKHIAHSGVTISAGVALSGGGGIDASRTIDFDLTTLNEDTAPDTTADYVITYDTSASEHKKVLGDNLVGAAVGDGRWYLTASQAIAAALSTAIIFETTAENNLQRGTFALGTGKYTATSAAGARVLVTTTIAASSLGAGQTMQAQIVKNGTTTMLRGMYRSQGGTAVTPYVSISAVVTLSFNETVGVNVLMSNATTMQGGESYSAISIVELG